MTELRETISKNLRKYRKQAKISQTELAKQLGISPSSVSNWEQGLNSIDIDTLFRVCKILGVKISQMADVETDYIINSSAVGSSDPKEELIAVVEKMSDQQAQATLDFVNRLEAYAREYNKRTDKTD